LGILLQIDILTDEAGCAVNLFAHKPFDAPEPDRIRHCFLPQGVMTALGTRCERTVHERHEKQWSRYDASQIQVWRAGSGSPKARHVIGCTDRAGTAPYGVRAGDNSIAEALAGRCDRIDSGHRRGGSVCVMTRQGYPNRHHEKEGRFSVEVCMRSARPAQVRRQR
jgi:hypothetical protein